MTMNTDRQKTENEMLREANTELCAAIKGILAVTEGMYVEFVSTEARLREAESVARRAVVANEMQFPPTPTP
jgi:hypothetical protein